MESEYKRKLAAFYAEFYGKQSEVSNKDIRKGLSRFPFCLNKSESNAFLSESVKAGVLVPRGFKFVFKRR